MAAELDGAGAVLNRYVYASRAHSPDLVVRGGTAYRVLTDHLGSVRAVVDATSGTVVQTVAYDAWGARTEDTAPGWQSLGYAGGLSDNDTRLVRFGARDYDPVAGRWTTKDPIGFAGGDANLYAYVGNGPVDRIDPSGTVSSENLEYKTEFGYARPKDLHELRDVVGRGAIYGATPDGYLADKAGVSGGISDLVAKRPPADVDIDIIKLGDDVTRIQGPVLLVEILGKKIPFGVSRRLTADEVTYFRERARHLFLPRCPNPRTRAEK